MKLAIVGSRDFTDYELLVIHVDEYIASCGVPEMIISGGAPGADALAERYADERGIPKSIHHAQCDKYRVPGKKNPAGVIRNTLISYECTHCIAFVSQESVGTIDTINKVRSQHKDVRVISID